MKEKIYAALLCAAVGDAMSLAAQTKDTQTIVAENGGYLQDLVPVPANGLAAAVGHPVGMCGAAFSSAYYLAEAIIKEGGCSPTSVKDGLLAWADHPEYHKFVGPNSKKGIAKLQGTVFPIDKQDTVACFNRGASCGAAMRSGVLGLLYHDAPEKLVDKVVTMALPTHNNYISIAGASAVAHGVWAALQEGADVYDVIDAGLKGAPAGYMKAMETPGVRPSAGPCNIRRIQLAVQLGIANKGNFDAALQELKDMIGSTIYTVDAMPAAFGCISATSSAEEAVLMAVNMGDDCTSVAAMTGFMAGALYGAAPEFEKFAAVLAEVNNMDLHKLAEDIAKGGLN